MKKIVQNLQNHKAAGLDVVTGETLTVSLDVICDQLTYRVNESLSSGVFPENLKAAKVVPIYKSGEKAIERIIDPYLFYRF